MHALVRLASQDGGLHSGAIGHSLVGVDALAQILAVEEVLRRRKITQMQKMRNQATSSGQYERVDRWLSGIKCAASKVAGSRQAAKLRACFLKLLTCSMVWTLGMRVEPPTSTTSWMEPCSEKEQRKRQHHS